MRRKTHGRTILVLILLTVFASGCATTAACRPGDSTVACCIKKYPLSPAESCAASPAEILETLMEMEAAFQATRHTEDDEVVDDFANNAPLPPWKQDCIRNFVYCVNENWTGSCYDCIRRCEGQMRWPFAACKPRSKKR